MHLYHTPMGSLSHTYMHLLLPLKCRQSLLQTWRVSWTKVKVNGSGVESGTSSYSTVPVVEAP
jgi:hypothetical protein